MSLEIEKKAKQNIVAHNMMWKKTIDNGTIHLKNLLMIMPYEQ